MTQTTDTSLIRERRDDDIPALAAALVEVHRLDGYPVEGVESPEAWLRLDNLLGAWTAEIDGRPVGHVALTEPGPGDDAARLWSEQTGAPLDTIAVVARMFVAPSGRGHALGRRLTQAAMSAAEHADRRAVLDVMHKDHAAIHTYESLGWKRFADLEHVHHVDQIEPGSAYVASKGEAHVASS